MNATLPSVVFGFIVLLAAFRLIERSRPKEQRLRILRRGFWTDLAYWAVTPLTSRVLALATVLLVVVPVAWLVHGRIDRDTILHGFGPLSRLPLWAQAVGIVLVSELAGYWMHRAFHTTRLWKFHAVHHSSVDLDWLSAVRVHPVNDVVMKLATTAPILALGFAPIAVAGITPVLSLLAIALHAHVDWDFGPLRGVIASPRFHRWHHTDEAEGRDRNFAGLLPVIDRIFGTWHMPRQRCPKTFGTSTPVPGGLLPQLLFPFRRQSGPWLRVASRQRASAVPESAERIRPVRSAP